jgi:hypothetical protein
VKTESNTERLGYHQRQEAECCMPGESARGESENWALRMNIEDTGKVHKKKHDQQTKAAQHVTVEWQHQQKTATLKRAKEQQRQQQSKRANSGITHHRPVAASISRALQP